MPQDDGRSDWYEGIVATYDAIAEQYAADYFDELSRKPFDRELLTRFAQLIPPGGKVCDMGCGPGHVARYLAGLGLDPLGVDISESMVAVARRLNPRLQFQQGDMLRLQFADESFAGITAFYSLIHIDRPRVPQALGELFRVLTKGGLLLVAFHAGEGEVHREEYHGQAVAFHASFFGIEELARFLDEAGFLVEESIAREPYDFEYQSRRAYILGRKLG
ncbi:MAG: class I SAM-dependent methyltransferase [Candidatus Korobacteraceae bacterium]|jgi:ubiquinone/menaquinone biosynthesis C-methylase UbiE